LFLLITIIPSGCKTYVKLKYGATQPKQETCESLIAFLKKNHFPVDNQYCFKDSASFFSMMRNPMVNENLLSHMLFDQHGNLMDRDTAKCQWAGSNVISNLDPDSVYHNIKPFRIDMITEQIIPFGQPDSGLFNPPSPDFTLVVLWARFIGRYNYRLFDLEKAVSDNKRARIRIIWLNIDMQKSWKLPKEKQLGIKG
jgi:hypothetical protein